MKLIKLISFALVFVPKVFFAQIEISSQKARTKQFPIVSTAGVASIIYDSNDEKLISHVAELLAEDIKNVSGKKPAVVDAASGVKDYAIIVGTIGKSQFIDDLLRRHKIKVGGLKGKWESFSIQTVDQPFKGITKALVIAGSDRRGTAYGAFTLSEKMGVSPWYWWADIPVKKRNEIYINDLSWSSKSPDIKYRGIFINDEDWGLQPWAAKTFEPEKGDMGPKTYAKICELLLRLKGNMFAPAMHVSTVPFYQLPENKVVTDEYGIVVTTSHCEPLLFNNASSLEWHSGRDGEWDYGLNKEGILKKLDSRVAEAHQYENLYTMGMRGLHDEGMRGDHTPQEKVAYLEDLIKEERKILEKYTKKPAEEINQIFVPYKETMQLYELGLKVPEDITLVWVDDNYGYIKRLSNAEEKKRSGGSGVYYHLSYLGPPHDYLWLNTTAPVLMYEELKKAYDMGANKYWLINVGDIKPAELGMQTFFDLAWDIEQFDIKSINKHQSKFLSASFPGLREVDFQDILDNYYRLAWSRKPEYMGWEREWEKDWRLEYLRNTQFSFNNYNDARQRLADYKRLSDKVTSLSKEVSAEYLPAFYELIEYPVKGAYQMNRKFLMSQFNDYEVMNNRIASANWAANEVQSAYDSINKLNERYNSMLNGKWNKMMMLSPGYNAKYQNMPHVANDRTTPAQEVSMEPVKDQNGMTGSTVLDLRNYKGKEETNGHSLRVIDNIGYDWNVIQLGYAGEKSVNPTIDGSRFVYDFPKTDKDSVTVWIYTLPTFPVHKGVSNRFGVSVDGKEPVVLNNEPAEFSSEWREQVLQNGYLRKVSFQVDSSKSSHSLALICSDPGVMIERVIVDWGGLKETYVGPSVENSKR